MYDRTTDETDTDGRISTLFRDSTVEIEPDVPGLVRGAIDRGRGKRRRRNVGVALAAAATVSVVGVTASVVSSLGSGGAGFDPAGAPASAAGPVTSTATSTAPPKATQPKSQPRTKPGRPPAIPTADIPVKAADLPRLFTTLYPGKVTPAEERTGRIIDDGRAGQYAHFLWNGAMTSVGFAAYSGTPAQRCRELQQDASQSGPRLNCLTRPDGTVSMSWRETAPARDGGGTGQGVSLFTKDGYEIFAISYNWARKGGPNLAEEPPLSIAQLTRAVTDDVWF
jgi:hypothetical protein